MPSLVTIAGVGQLTQRPDDPEDALEPVAMMTEVVRRAADDAGSSRLAEEADAIAVVRGAWRYSDPARLVADAVGAKRARTILTSHGGNTPQSLVNHFAQLIAAGEMDIAIVVGAEAIHSRGRARALGQDIEKTTQTDVEPDEHFGSDSAMGSEAEQSRGVAMPIQFYPIFENAYRAARGDSIDQQRDRLARLWARFNEVAVANPYAWSRRPMTAEQIREATPDNRMVGFPYTKAMNSNWFLDQAAAVIVCSPEAAEGLGVSADRLVFLHAGTDSHDTYLVSNRLELHSSPAIRIAGRRVLDLAGVDVHDVDHVDLYSCFPSAVQIAAAEIGLSPDRQLTVTGGLTFAGGPLNNYVTHSIATMVGVLRDDPGSIGLVSASGGFLTKHAFGVYSTSPPPAPFQNEDLQPEVDATPPRDYTHDYD